MQEHEFRVSDVYYSHFSPALLEEFSLLWIWTQEFSHKTNADLTSDLKISISLAYCIQETGQEQIWDRSQSAPTACEIIN